MGVVRSAAVADIIRRGSIRDSDVVDLRQAYNEDATIGVEEAERLIAVNNAGPAHEATWDGFYIEAITDFIVNQSAPEGYVTAENANWLMSRIAKDGRIQRKTELDLLISVLERARWSPASLAGFALAQVKWAVIEGDGPLRAGRSLARGTIGDGEVALLRRILNAGGGAGTLPVSRAEAEILLDIDGATAEAPLNAAWIDLFVKAMTNAVMAGSGYSAPAREEALRVDARPESGGDDRPTPFLAATVASSFGSVRDAYQEQSPEERALARLERQRVEIITNEVAAKDEAEWFARRLGGDGPLSPAVAALIQCFKSEGLNVNPSRVILPPAQAKACDGPAGSDVDAEFAWPGLCPGPAFPS